MVPTPHAIESRLQLPRWIAALFVGIIAIASAVALIAPTLQQRAYGLGQGVPTTFFIDADGIVRAATVGEMDTATIATNLSKVRR